MGQLTGDELQGQPRQTVLEVVDYDEATDTYSVAAAWGGKSDWYRNIQANPAVAIWIGSSRYPIAQRFLPTDEAVVDRPGPLSLEIPTVAVLPIHTEMVDETVKSLARIGGSVPAVPAPGGVRLMLSVIKVVFAGRVSDITAPVALAVPLLLTTIV